MAESKFSPGLHRLFDPQTIAVVGASNDPKKPGHSIVRSLIRFSGEVFPVNENHPKVCGFQAYPSLSAIGKSVDLVILVIPAEAVVASLREADIEIGGCLIITSGFNETGDDGSRRQAELKELCEQRGIPAIGPNTAGFMNPARDLFATFIAGAETLKAGNVGIISQSGAISMAFSFLARQSHLGLSVAVGLGNMMDIAHDHVVSYMADDDRTGVILLYAEGLARGRELFEAVRSTVPKKPVVVLLVGKSDIEEFASSHTGNLIGSYALKKSALEQAGAIVVDSVTEAVDAANALTKCRLAPNSRPAFGVVTAQAGAGMLIMDTLGVKNVRVPRLRPETVDSLNQLLPALTFVENPVDTGRPTQTFGDVLQTVAGDEQIDALLTFALEEPDAIAPVEVMAELKIKTDVPVMFGTVGLDSASIETSLSRLSTLGVPGFATAERLAAAAAAVARDAQNRAALQAAAAESISQYKAGPIEVEGPVDEAEAKEILRDYGFLTPAGVVCRDHDEVRQAFKTLAAPAVLKVLDAGIAHKTEVGGVHLDIVTPEQLEIALAAIDDIGGSGEARRYLLEDMAIPGVDLILGAKNDAVFGPTVLLGLGGTAAEALGDVVLRLAPVTPSEARSMLPELRCKKLLDSWRGANAVDKDAVVEGIVRLSHLIAQNPHISEMDLNPVRADARGAVVLDALIQFDDQT